MKMTNKKTNIWILFGITFLLVVVLSPPKLKQGTYGFMGNSMEIRLLEPDTTFCSSTDYTFSVESANGDLTQRKMIWIADFDSIDPNMELSNIYLKARTEEIAGPQTDDDGDFSIHVTTFPMTSSCDHCMSWNEYYYQDCNVAGTVSKLVWRDSDATSLEYPPEYMNIYNDDLNEAVIRAYEENRKLVLSFTCDNDADDRCEGKWAMAQLRLTVHTMWDNILTYNQEYLLGTDFSTYVTSANTWVV